MKPAKNMICLWYNGDAEEAARFYAETFPDSSVDAVHRAPSDYPSGKEGDVITVDFTVMGKKAILSALSERNEEAEICRDKDGNPEADPELRDTESVPLAESIESFFEREVKPHVPDAWIDRGRRDPKDGEVGLVGYEINFNRYFYEYRPPRPLEAIEADIQAIEKDIVAMLREVAG